MTRAAAAPSSPAGLTGEGIGTKLAQAASRRCRLLLRRVICPAPLCRRRVPRVARVLEGEHARRARCRRRRPLRLLQLSA
eukprot:4676053-Pleurochrysis_carterae.AAC.1